MEKYLESWNILMKEFNNLGLDCESKTYETIAWHLHVLEELVDKELERNKKERK